MLLNIMLNTVAEHNDHYNMFVSGGCCSWSGGDGGDVDRTKSGPGGESARAQRNSYRSSELSHIMCKCILGKVPMNTHAMYTKNTQ